MAEKIFSKLASPALRKKMEHKEQPEKGAKHHPGLGQEEGGEEVKEAPGLAGREEEGTTRPMKTTTTTPAVVGAGPGGLGLEESTGMRTGTAAKEGGGGELGGTGGVDVEETSGWTGGERLVGEYVCVLGCGFGLAVTRHAFDWPGTHSIKTD
jgi:hypothetical protein